MKKVNSGLRLEDPIKLKLAGLGMYNNQKFAEWVNAYEEAPYKMKLPNVSNLIINDIMTWGDALLRGNLSTCATDKILNDLAQALVSLKLKVMPRT